MNEEQFSNMMKLLIQIEFNTRKEKISHNFDAVRDAFYHQLEAKTGWGRNEVKEIFEVAIKSVIE